MADYAIHDTTLIGTSNIIRKKEGSSALIDPADYPKRINLMGLLEEKTASGSIVTFSDGADAVPLKKCEVALSASLDGYSSVTVHHTDGQTPPVFSEDYTASLGRTIYGGSVDVVNGTGTDENGNDFTFSPVEINSRLGDNTMWSEQGDMSVIYRSSGTVTPIQPTLISKTITANGTYTAEDDGADGYDEVVVNVAQAEPTVTPLNSPNPFLIISGISGTDVTRVARTITAPSDGKYIFASDSTCMTNTGSGDGFIDIQKNDVSVVKQYMSANTTTAITIPDIDVEAGDEVDIVVGFDNAHSSCNFQLYTGIAFVSEASSASLLSMSPSEEVNENEEVEENETT